MANLWPTFSFLKTLGLLAFVSNGNHCVTSMKSEVDMNRFATSLYATVFAILFVIKLSKGDQEFCQAGFNLVAIVSAQAL